MDAACASRLSATGRQVLARDKLLTDTSTIYSQLFSRAVDPRGSESPTGLVSRVYRGTNPPSDRNQQVV